jgi:hypothetical protein
MLSPEKSLIFLRLFGMVFINSLSCLGGGQSLRSLSTAARYLDSLSTLEKPALFYSPLMGHRSVYVYECLSAIFMKPIVNISNSSKSEFCEATCATARTTLQRACVTSDAFSFNHQIELLLMLRSEILKCPMSWTVFSNPDIEDGNKSKLQSEDLSLITGIQCEEKLSVQQTCFISKVSLVMRQFFGADTSLAIVGSSACGLGSPHSDLDLTILMGYVSSTSFA